MLLFLRCIVTFADLLTANRVVMFCDILCGCSSGVRRRVQSLPWMLSSVVAVMVVMVLFLVFSIFMRVNRDVLANTNFESVRARRGSSLEVMVIVLNDILQVVAVRFIFIVLARMVECLSI